MGTILEFTDEEKVVLRDLIKNHKATITRPPLTASERLHQAPETYVAKPKTSAGIPKLLSAGTGTGSDVSGSEYDEPGVAECDIYRIQVNQTTGDPELQAVPGLSKMVYNISTTAVSQTWTGVTRTKSGRWLAINGGGSGGAASIRFQVLSAGPFLGLVPSDDCDFVVARVLGVSCSSSGVSVGDEVYVWDPSYCHFNLPLSILVGAKGTATSMVNDLDGVVTCLDYRPGSCRWVVHSLCCTEEVCG